ncbi:hypothetical protein GPECTOR_16g762 [Gonium pectorale]|uniref:Uncharacterized protein n=1 Tax=Gonium pectorale TaxID=33097 RepID=A0A150GLC6_GONPE|nr:hypothetical protein GPECTOR_16g762 [Gonium pectorale]|eukprot:KXZ50587.1 hypothetical protein GPECTOR_16g762 [Gonium pectorale]
MTLLLCNNQNRGAYVIAVSGTYDAVVYSLSVSCSDGNFIDAGIDWLGDNSFSLVDFKGFVGVRADSINADPSRLGFRNSSRTWLAGPPKLPIGNNTWNGSTLRVVSCDANQILAGLAVVVGKPFTVNSPLAITRLDPAASKSASHAAAVEASWRPP